MGWTFVYLMVILKVPIVALFLIVRWAVKQTPEPPQAERDDGGIKRPLHPHPRSPLVRPRHRGPHGGAQIPAPARMRCAATRARAREL